MVRAKSIHRSPYHGKRAGFSLVECTFSILLAAVVIVGAMQAVGATLRTRTQSVNQRRALELAQMLLTEIMQGAYIDPGSAPNFGKETGESRSTFNDVDDYDNYIEFLSVKDKNGNSLSGYSLWSRGVGVEWVDPVDPTGASVSTDMGLKRIRVTASYLTGETATVHAYRASNGIGEQKPMTTSTYVTWVGANVTVGTNKPIITGMSLTNSAQ